MEFSIDTSSHNTGDKNRLAPKLTLVVPCYNEEDGLQDTATQLIDILNKLCKSGSINEQSRLCMIDDGSTDRTWEIICTLNKSEPMCCGLQLTRNFGHQNALLAGLLSCPGDVLISLDADLQDDPAIIADMLQAYRDGADIVFAVRDDRSVDTFWKRTPARAYYKLLSTLGVNVIEDHADYRLISRKVVNSLQGYREVNLFLRGLLPQLGYSQAFVKYKRQKRNAGKTKYPLLKMLSLAVNGITSFSAAPLRLIALVGLLVFFGSISVSAWALWIKLFTDNAIPGWASSVIPMYFLGGVQLLSIAVVGEYVSKIYLETKARPRFLLRETLGLSGKTGDEQ
jgi:glycosyltransferase involved in cell wall biosynthesis